MTRAPRPDNRRRKDAAEPYPGWYDLGRPAEIRRRTGEPATRDAEARRGIVGLQPKRAEVILAGACIVRTVMEKLGQQTLTVSDRGLRHGLLIDRFGT